MTHRLPTAFFAYPSQPAALPETVRAAVEQINGSKQTYVRTWEEAKISGKPIIHEICKAIEEVDLLIADLTGLNANVLFEVGYAIAKNKRTWSILDTSLGAAEFAELKTRRALS
jgi:nucleoside 2-deoxyribosyltransferase